MRHITRLAIQALLNGETFKQGNTEVKDGELYLHGNLIIKMVEDGFLLDACGRYSKTTKERLNGLCCIRLQQIKGEWYLNDKCWNGSKIKFNIFKQPMEWNYV